MHDRVAMQDRVAMTDIAMNSRSEAPLVVLESESIVVPLRGGDRLHLRRFPGDPSGPPILMVHGAIENGRIFWSRSGRGLAPFLAAKGFDVYVADLRGRGESLPHIGPGSDFGQTDAIVEDLPALVEAIVERRGRIPQGWVAHSWGGVLLSSFLARFPRYRELVATMVYFGSKRRVRVLNPESFFKINLVWSLVCPLAIAFKGYLPARRLGFGSDSETARSYKESATWVARDPWVDPEDGFDYGAALREAALPPVWYIAGGGDRALGHPRDVRDFMAESGQGENRLTVLSPANGNIHNYDHIDMLTHPDAVRDHFPAVAAWLREGLEAHDG